MKRITTLLAAAALAVALAGTGLAVANAVTSTPTYHGCVEGSSRVLENVHTTTVTCPKGNLAVTWNQKGPAGPQGVQGVQGPAGPSTAGPAGLDTTIVSTFSPTPPCGGQGSVCNPVEAVSCPASHPYVLGGGGQVANGAINVSAATSGYPGGWEVIYYGDDTFMSVQAICAK